jgi:hypothetical protein
VASRNALRTCRVGVVPPWTTAQCSASARPRNARGAKQRGSPSEPGLDIRIVSQERIARLAALLTCQCQHGIQRRPRNAERNRGHQAHHVRQRSEFRVREAWLVELVVEVPAVWHEDIGQRVVMTAGARSPRLCQVFNSVMAVRGVTNAAQAGWPVASVTGCPCSCR